MQAEVGDNVARRSTLGILVAGLAARGPAVRFLWPLANDYGVVNGRIEATGTLRDEPGEPLASPDLFASLARFSADGDPSETAMLRWVRKFGLFTNEEDERGDPVPVEDLRNESRQALEALVLFHAVRMKNYDELRDQLTAWSSDGGSLVRYLHTHHSVPHTELAADTDLANAVAEWKDEEVVSLASEFLGTYLGEAVTSKLTFGMALGRPLPDNDYRPTPAWVPRDLLSALWFRLVLEMADPRPWRVCMGCGLPFLVTRDDQTTCPGSQTCLRRRQRRVHFGR